MVKLDPKQIEEPLLLFGKLAGQTAKSGDNDLAVNTVVDSFSFFVSLTSNVPTKKSDLSRLLFERTFSLAKSPGSPILECYADAGLLLLAAGAFSGGPFGVVLLSWATFDFYNSCLKASKSLFRNPGERKAILHGHEGAENRGNSAWKETEKAKTPSSVLLNRMGFRNRQVHGSGRQKGRITVERGRARREGLAISERLGESPELKETKENAKTVSLTSNVAVVRCSFVGEYRSHGIEKTARGTFEYYERGSIYDCGGAKLELPDLGAVRKLGVGEPTGERLIEFGNDRTETSRLRIRSKGRKN